MLIFLGMLLCVYTIVVIEHYKYKAKYYQEQSDLWELKFEILSGAIKEI